MKITIVISYYKALDNLKIIIEALNNQSDRDFELIVSEDDINQETLNFIEDAKIISPFDIYHIHQLEDKGFRKNKMLNRAILTSHTDYMVFIDGDCIPHKYFVKQYKDSFREGFIFIGRSVMLSEKLSQQIKKEQTISKLTFTNVLFSNSKMKKEGIYFPSFQLSAKTRGLVGRNWGIYKQHLIDVNGFDEDYVFAGVGEDVDIEWRLLSSGITRKSVKNKAIVYHLYHERGYSEVNVAQNYQLLFEKQKKNNIVCLNGLEKL